MKEMPLPFPFQAAKPSSGSSMQSPTQEYVVRAPSDGAKKFSMIKFSTGTDIDFLKLTNVCKKKGRKKFC